jgi:hypothetical protein
MRSGPDDRHIWISFADEGLGPRRCILLHSAEAVFDQIGATDLLTLVRPEDLDRRHALQRLGFRRVGSSTCGKIVLSLGLSRLPPALRAYRARHRH